MYVTAWGIFCSFFWYKITSINYLFMYILKDIKDAVYLPLTVSSISYFFMGKNKRAKYISEKEHVERVKQREVEERRAQMRAWREKAIKAEQERKKRLEADAEAKAWEDQREAMFKAHKDKEIQGYKTFFDVPTPNQDNDPKDHTHPLRDDHHHHRDHHNDHKATWGHDVGWNHGSDSTHHSHDSGHSHDSSSDSSSDSGGGDSGGDGGGGD
jgi:uncharacterized membrane protein YgcG